MTSHIINSSNETLLDGSVIWHIKVFDDVENKVSTLTIPEDD